MRQAIEQWLNQIWYGGNEPPAWLKALSPLYRKGFLLHKNFRQARQPESLKGRAIVVVGNLTVGGSGKTPLVIRLCRIFQQAGLQPGVVSRGYGRKSKAMIEVTSSTTAAEAGDEPLVIARRASVPVVVAADRCAAAVKLFSMGVKVVIADDGLQHHRLPRSMEICVIDGEREFGNKHLLPAGPLREPIERLSEVDYIIINSDDDQTGSPDGTIRMQLLPGLLCALSGNETWRLSQFSGCRVNAVAGIGNPDRFFKSLQSSGLHAAQHIFPDHHAYTAEDFSSMEPGLPVIMTEKDAVKCSGLKLKNAWYLSVEASLPSALESELLARLDEVIQSREGE